MTDPSVKTSRLTLQLQRDLEAGVWIATSDQVPGLVVQGKTLQEIGRKCDLCIPALTEDQESLLVARLRMQPGLVVYLGADGGYHLSRGAGSTTRQAIDAALVKGLIVPKWDDRSDLECWRLA